MPGYLIIQTAFIGDAILATPVIEQLHALYPEQPIDILVRKGNETLFLDHPKLRHVHVWDKKKHKYRNLLRLLIRVRKNRYEGVINLQRFLATGLLTVFSRARHRVGFNKNPLAFLFTQAVQHDIHTGQHEVDRNLALLASFAGEKEWDYRMPRLYPRPEDQSQVAEFVQPPYVCIAPSSVWFTKQLPFEKWLQLMKRLPDSDTIYLLGGPGDRKACEQLVKQSPHPRVFNLAGKLGLLASAALMENARLNYVNDSAPMHLASAVGAPTVAFFCSTVPAFGFGPLSPASWVVETETQLSCRPCDLHGKKTCPEGHFRCAKDIDMDQVKV